MTGTGPLDAVTCYQVVYYVVEKAIKETTAPKGCEAYFEWAKRIPSPPSCSFELASALCTSVSHTKNVGLECFFQIEISEKELKKQIGDKLGSVEHEILRNIALNERDQPIVINIGRFVRNFYNGDLVMTENQLKLLESL
jgi:hypothetical protein